MLPAILAQVGYRGGWPGFWIFLAVVAIVIGVVLFLFMRSQPPPGGPPISGPRVGE